MNLEAYDKARKAGLKTYSSALANKEDPYVPCLSDLVPKYEALNRVNCGIMTIPLDRIVGTVTKGRSNAFAKDFMPLLESSTEFAQKWIAVQESIEEEGLNNPVSVVEYMGMYYLMEGNKRVSVMRFLESDSIEANVIRYLPEVADTDEYRVYMEYLDFGKRSGIYDILMTEPGSYERLIKLTGHEGEEKWTAQASKYLKADYRCFAVQYKALASDKKMPAGDAFLTYLIAYGYQQISQKSLSEIDSDISRLKDEFIRKGSGEQTNLVLDKEPVKKAGLVSSLFRPSSIKAAFLFTREIEQSAWNYRHELGRLALNEALGDSIETSAHIISSRTQFEEEIEQLIADGNKLIFATSPVMLNSCIKPSLEHKDVKLLCCSLLTSYLNVRSYYIRFFEVKLLLGMAAGACAGGGNVGYIADYPIYGAASSINAFAMGVKMVNPNAKVYLTWSTVKDFDIDKAFEGKNVTVISNRDITAPAATDKTRGVYALKGEEKIPLARPHIDWSKFYIYAAKSMLETDLGSTPENAALDYWWGLSSGSLDIYYEDAFPIETRRMIEHFKYLIIAGEFTPFAGRIVDNKGLLRCDEESVLTPAEVLCMDYLTDNVVGEFPDIDTLIPAAVPIVRLQGLNGELKPDVKSIKWN